MSFNTIDEHVVAGQRLGRHVNHDPRSLRYLHPRTDLPVVNKLWSRNAPILDQGNLGSCTGNSAVGNLATSPVFDALPAGHPALNEAEAVKVYSLATQLDPYSGQYPPTDTGSDGLSAAKALKQLGFISGYTHCTDLATMLQALMVGPVMIGINWYSSFDTPAADGTVTITKGAYIRGGHEPMVRGVDVDNQLLLADNSWGTSWGVNGSFKIPFSVMTRLLSESGDCTVPVPLSAPAPTPNPPPSPSVATDADKVLDSTVRPWVDQTRTRPDLVVLKNALVQWETDSGLR